MLRNAFLPSEARTKTILTRGTIVEVTDEQGEQLVENKYAAEFEETKDSGKGDTPSDKWTIPELTKYAADNKIDLAGATKKTDILAAIGKGSAAPTT